MKILKRLLRSLPIVSPKYYYSKEEYYNDLITPHTIVDLMRHLNNEEQDFISTTKKVRFKEVEFGNTLEEIITQLGKPRHIITNKYNNSITHSILFYKERIGKFQAVSQLHLINNKFYLGVHLFNDLEPKDVKDLEEILLLKYLNGNEGCDLKRISFRDNDDNRIELKKEVHTSISYISGNKVIIKYLNEQITQTQQVVKSKKEKELIRLYNIL
jgi:hypothetical protein